MAKTNTPHNTVFLLTVSMALALHAFGQTPDAETKRLKRGLCAFDVAGALLKGNTAEGVKDALLGCLNPLLKPTPIAHETQEPHETQEEYRPNGTLRERYGLRDTGDGKRLKHGRYTYFDERGNKRKEGWYSFGLKAGMWTTYHPNGQIDRHCEYVNDARNGWCIRLDDEGRLERAAQYQKGEKHGKYVTYYDNGNKHTVRHYKFGDLNGPARSYNSHGKLIFEYTYKDGQKHGLWRQWSYERIWKGCCEFVGYGSPYKAQEGIYVKGKKEGTWTKWWRGGQQKAAQGPYKNGKRTGTWTSWHDDGRVMWRGDYKNGKKHGIWMLGGSGKTVSYRDGKKVR